MEKKKENAREEEVKGPKRLYRSRKDKVIAGVCGGIAEYLNIDPVWVRLIAILTIFLDGMGLIFYIIAWILMPKNPMQEDTINTRAEAIAEKAIDRINKKIEARQNRKKGGIKEVKHVAEKKVIDQKTMEANSFREQAYAEPYETKDRGVVFLGMVLLLIGALFLMKNLFSWFEFKYAWALALIAAGIYLIVRRSK
jgi:phage shock protein C